MTVFFDLDETLVHCDIKWDKTAPDDTIQWDDTFKFGSYECFLKVRDSAQTIIDYARAKVGAENVFILTAAAGDYASKINELAGFGFGEEQIFAREYTKKYLKKKQYSPNFVKNPLFSGAILIDNLPAICNSTKVELLDLPLSRYLEIAHFHGNESAAENERFVKQVKDFINDQN